MVNNNLLGNNQSFLISNEFIQISEPWLESVFYEKLNGYLIQQKITGTHTGWSISFLYTLYDWYDKNNVCMKIFLVGICSVHRDISSKTNNWKFSKFLLSKKYILDLGSILAQNSTYSFEGVWA